jgi:hypothetical protein
VKPRHIYTLHNLCQSLGLIAKTPLLPNQMARCLRFLVFLNLTVQSALNLATSLSTSAEVAMHMAFGAMSSTTVLTSRSSNGLFSQSLAYECKDSLLVFFQRSETHMPILNVWHASSDNRWTSVHTFSTVQLLLERRWMLVWPRQVHEMVKGLWQGESKLSDLDNHEQFVIIVGEHARQNESLR